MTDIPSSRIPSANLAIPSATSSPPLHKLFSGGVYTSEVNTWRNSVTQCHPNHRKKEPHDPKRQMPDCIRAHTLHFVICPTPIAPDAKQAGRSRENYPT